MLDCAVKTSARNTCIGCCIGCSAAPALAGANTQIAARNRPIPCARRRCRVLRLPRIVSGMPLRLCWLAPAIPPVIRRGATPRIGRLYSQAESRRKSPDRERGCGSAGSIAEGSFSIRLERQGIVRQVFETDPRQGDTEFLFRAGRGCLLIFRSAPALAAQVQDAAVASRDARRVLLRRPGSPALVLPRR